MNYEEYIQKRFEGHLDAFNKKFPNLELVYMAVQGSQNYGLDYYGDGYCSDLDTKAIVLPSLDDIVQDKQPLSFVYVLENNEHIDIKDIRVMFEMFKKQNINFIEILFSHYNYINPKYADFFKELIINREKIARYNHNQTLRCIAGMSMEKLKAMCHPYPTIKDKIDKYGYDGKQLHHIIRMNDFMYAFVVLGMSYEASLSHFKDKDLLFDAKFNKFSLEDALCLAERYDNDTKELKEKFSKDVEKTDKEVEELLNKVKYQCIKKHILEEVRK